MLMLHHDRKAPSSLPTNLEKEIAKLLYRSCTVLTTNKRRGASKVQNRAKEDYTFHVEVEMSPGLNVIGRCRNFFEPLVSPVWAERMEKRLCRSSQADDISKKEALIVDFYLKRSAITQRWLSKILPDYETYTDRNSRSGSTNTDVGSFRIREITYRDPVTCLGKVEVHIQCKKRMGIITYAPAILRSRKATASSHDKRVLETNIPKNSLYSMRVKATQETQWKSWKRSTPLPLNGIIITQIEQARVAFRTSYLLASGLTQNVTRSKSNPVKIDVSRTWEARTLREAQGSMERGEMPSVSVELEYVTPPRPLQTPSKKEGVCTDENLWLEVAKHVLQDSISLLKLGNESDNF